MPRYLVRIEDMSTALVVVEAESSRRAQEKVRPYAQFALEQQSERPFVMEAFDLHRGDDTEGSWTLSKLKIMKRSKSK